MVWDRYPEYFSQQSETQTTSSVTGYEAADGGVSLTQTFNQMSVTTPSYSNSLIDSDIPDRDGSVKPVDAGWATVLSKEHPVPTKSASDFNSNMTNRSDDTATAKNGWAKIKAYKPEKPPVRVPAPDDDWKSESEESERREAMR